MEIIWHSILVGAGWASGFMTFLLVIYYVSVLWKKVSGEK